ncbi:hypothetical protein CEXT_442821 [Caerostris extrusa]|uniref:Uncharacterized protein n=1 Tax=Caerostris extrusa TaxID=172846 RepID=A0AAV4PGC6_CAEEX|nr:hypothetical protein CEXT_442821 [Caerostris extrusa]
MFCYLLFCTFNSSNYFILKNVLACIIIITIKIEKKKYPPCRQEYSCQINDLHAKWLTINAHVSLAEQNKCKSGWLSAHDFEVKEASKTVHTSPRAIYLARLLISLELLAYETAQVKLLRGKAKKKKDAADKGGRNIVFCNSDSSC